MGSTRKTIDFHLFLTFVRSRHALVGGGPTATHFSCFAKKSEQKKATQAQLAFGFPIAQGRSVG